YQNLFRRPSFSNAYRYSMLALEYGSCVQNGIKASIGSHRSAIPYPTLPLSKKQTRIALPLPTDQALSERGAETFQNQLPYRGERHEVRPAFVAANDGA